MKADILLADKAFDADQRVIKPLEAAGKTCVIPPKSNRRNPRPFDKEIYKARHLIENFYCSLKRFRAIEPHWVCRRALVATHGPQMVRLLHRYSRQSV
jgi:transposase